MKSLYIAEKPSVAQEFGKALHQNLARRDGYLESDESIVTWCVGHLVTMSYPDQYDPKYKRWSFDTIPFLPEQFRYEIIPSVKKQFQIVKGLLNREDVDVIYVCTDAGREGEYIYRLVAQMAGIRPGQKTQKRVWIDSQTEEEILRGIREAKDLREYDHLGDAAYLRAKEDYLMGINFSRALSLRYARSVQNYLGGKYQAISVGRVMTCVLGMVVRREREIRDFVKVPFYRVLMQMELPGKSVPLQEPAPEQKNPVIEGEWRVWEKSRYNGSPALYRENGFRERSEAQKLIGELGKVDPQKAAVWSIERKTEKKHPPLLYNLAELQNDCSKRFKISPDQTLQTAQELYEKKLVTYPRTDARVLSSAIAKEIRRNLEGLRHYGPCAQYAEEILAGDAWKSIGKTRYTNDKQVTDHYAIIPTGQGLGALNGCSDLTRDVYNLIVRRFLSIFYPDAVYKKVTLITELDREHFHAAFRILESPGYLKAAGLPKSSREDETQVTDSEVLERLAALKKGDLLDVPGYRIREGETTPPKRYTSGSMILAMENAGQLIEDEDLRAQIRGSGIGTSATRAEILKKLQNIKYIALNKKTQVITPTQMGEIVYDVVDASVRPLLNPELTASWEKGLTYVSEGTITPGEYMEKLSAFVSRNTNRVKSLRNERQMIGVFEKSAPFYRNKKHSGKK